MAQRNRHAADETFIPWIEEWTFDNVAADRIRPIENYARNPGGGTRFQTVLNRPRKGVNASADVLQVDHKAIEAPEHLGGRLADFAIEAIDRQIEGLIAAVRRLDHVGLLLAPKAVLRGEDGLLLIGVASGEKVA